MTLKGRHRAHQRDEAYYRSSCDRDLRRIGYCTIAALAAWDRYLAVDARGPLVLEARFNRAVCLVSLGRKAEARLALAPFANGEYGSYRRNEARTLRSRLSQPATSAQ